MTRLGPLTSQALGRSPYDNLVVGDGEADPREPPQEYDERGRPINLETKRINRNIVRSHNEVMQVIGVAEPDSLMTAESESESQVVQQHYEDMVGRKLWDPARILGAVGVWGAEPLRQRALLYKRFSEYPPWQNFRKDYGLRPVFELFVTGFPATFVDGFLRNVEEKRGYIPGSPWKHMAIKYVRLHLQYFTCLQRLSIIPATFPWLPGPLFFIPFSGESPIAPLPSLPTSFSIGGAAEWLVGATLCFAPLAVFYGYSRLREWLTFSLDYAIYDTLDVPSNPPLQRPVHVYHPLTGEPRYAGLPAVVLPSPPGPMPTTTHRERPAVPPPPPDSQRLLSEGDEQTDSGRRNAIDGTQEELEADAEHEPTSGEPSGSSEVTPTQPQHQHRTSTTPQPGSPTETHHAPQRRNTVSSAGGGGDGYASEEEEFELSATLISFDVEAGSAGDAPNNPWSAELRQSAAVSIAYEPEGFGHDGGVNAAHGTYHRGVFYPTSNAPFQSDTMLSRLPATVFAASAASLCAKLTLVDCESAVVRILARTYRMQHNEPTSDLHGLSMVPFPFMPNGMLSLNAMCHYAMAVLMEATVKSAGVLATLGVSYLYRGSKQGWSFYRVCREKLNVAANLPAVDFWTST